MEYKFNLESGACIDHDQILDKLYPDLDRVYDIEKFNNGYIVIITLHNIDELLNLQKRVHHKIEIISHHESAHNDSIGTLTIMDDV